MANTYTQIYMHVVFAVEGRLKETLSRFFSALALFSTKLK
jgi:hypothetical protein